MSRSRSRWPWRADSEIAANASLARAGSASTSRCPAAAWITITLIAWPTMSCSSLAIRARSCRRAISAKSSRSSSSSWARTASWSAVSLRRRSTVPATNGGTVNMTAATQLSISAR